VGGVIRIGREDVEGEAFAVAVGRGAHPEAVELAGLGIGDALEPDLAAHEGAPAVEAVALAGGLRRAEGIVMLVLVARIERLSAFGARVKRFVAARGRATGGGSVDVGVVLAVAGHRHLSFYASL